MSEKVFARSQSERWFEITLPQGEPFAIGDVLRDPEMNDVITHLQFGGEKPESPKPVPPSVLNREPEAAPVVDEAPTDGNAA